jgi:FlaA1/EpsC-like NDP-sugar epimerase
VTVTDPEVTRFFMTVQEAVQLVIQAAVIGNDGEALVLDMGEPVRIADVARQLVEWSERDIEIVYTGLHYGEKLHEELFGAGEQDVRPVHPLISHVQVPATPATDLLIDLHAGREEIVSRLDRCCAEMKAQELRGAA